jgi:hypothetical protein
MWNTNEDVWSECQMLMDKSTATFGDVFKKTKDIKQLIKQCEIDVLGINAFNNSLFAVDIAYHSGGLGYKNSLDVVTKKILRTVFALKLYFPDIETCNIYFISPIVNNRLNDELNIRIKEIVSFLQKNNTNYNVELFSNEKFKIDILNTTIKMSNDIADMSELFLRSYRLISLFENQNESTPVLITKSQPADELSEELAIGELAQTQFRLLLEKDMLSNDMLGNLQNLEYCRITFGVNYPILKRLNDKINIREERKINGHYRYYAKPINNFLLCYEWYEKHRNALGKWLLSLDNQKNLQQ